MAAINLTSQMADTSIDTLSNEDGPLSSVPLAPQDPMFGLSAAYRRDTHPCKVDLGVGAYRDGNLEPYVLTAVEQAKELLIRDRTSKHEYLPIAGLDTYTSAARTLVLGNECKAIRENRVASTQTLSGTGALHLGAAFLERFFPESPAKKVYVSSPPYVNHLPILHHVSLQTGLYPYYSPATQGFDFQNMIDTLHSIPEQSIVLLHACAHNPTGVDPTRKQWMEIARIMKARHQLPFFDCAYQGFASGDVDSDAWAIRHFVRQGFGTIMIAQSFAKNFGLYGERAGCLHVVTATSDLASRLLSQLTILQRVEISTPPAFGARIVSLVLNDRLLRQQWVEDLKTMSSRIINMRSALRKHLEIVEAPGSWNHITDQAGMFCFTGLTDAQVMQLRSKYHIYMTNNGRISIAGLNEANVAYVAKAIKNILLRADL